MSDQAESLCIFEDERWSRLMPLTATRPMYGLRLGMWTLRERIVSTFNPDALALQCRDVLAASVREDERDAVVNTLASDRCLFVNGRIVADDALAAVLEGEDDCVYRSGDGVVAARVSGNRLEKIRERLDAPLDESVWEGLPSQKADARLIRYPWDLVTANPGQITRDFEQLTSRRGAGQAIPSGVGAVNKGAIHLGPECRVAPGVILDADAGPIVLGPGAEVRANAVIRGPAVIGRESLVQPLAMIEATTVGPVSRLGGEIRECILQGYDNKQHSGFLGHAYLGEWVNLGAETTNSDLKNNYSTVRTHVDGKQVDSGELFVGCFVGDHTKTAIGTRINTGSVFGVSCLLYGPGFLPKYVPSFTWLGHEGPVKYSLQKALETARVVMARRGVPLTSSKETVLRGIYEATKSHK